MRSLRLLCTPAAFVALVVAVAPPVAAAQTVINPYFLLLMDSSGSMTGTTGTAACRNSCGVACTKINDAKCALQRMVAGVGDATFGLGQFAQACSTNGCSTPIANSTCNTTAASGVIRVGIYDGNQAAITSWVDYVCGVPSGGICATTTSHNEIMAAGNTPLEGVLRRARCYFSGTCGADGTPASPLISDPALACRPVSVILLTDGAETCGGTAVNAATALRNTPVGAGFKNIKTYVIGFGMASGNAAINAIAAAGGTTTGYYATNEATLSLALSQIIADSALVESCNNRDDTCNSIIDEGLPKWCPTTAFGVASADCTDTAVNRHATCTECVETPEVHCDGVDNNCNGLIDEGLRNACGVCGAAAAEICDGLDNDCNGVIDDPPVCGSCTPSTEICDAIDNDCDGSINEGLTRPCGAAIGICTVGTQTCAMDSSGTWGACTGITPSTEICDGLDNDCNGVIDGMTRPCGTDVGECHAGVEVCTAGAYGTCLGSIGATAEVCDTLDNDCDGAIDESDPALGTSCGETISPCVAGSIQCVMGALVCVGAIGPTEEICDGIDNDCDGTIDDGLAVGTSCGSDVGECVPGTNVCEGGVLTCVGEIGVLPETCNGLDDDCNGIIDDVLGAGAACGTDVGVCTAGTMQCLAGVETCVGSSPPGIETCDCSDNDCDGTVDEEPTTGSLCPTGTACIECGCAGPCEVTEFGNSCSTGTEPLVVGADCWCVPSAGRCVDATCAGQTVAQAGTVVCAPDTAGTPACTCRGNTCTFPCEGVTCTGGTVCAPDTGLCVEPSCRTFGCATNEYCDAISGGCVVNPCATTTCAADEACRDGVCEPSCGGVHCAAGELCTAGVCGADLCAGVTCSVASQVCNPTSGLCVADGCATITCPRGTVCDLDVNSCVVDPCLRIRCPADQVCTNGECVVEVALPDMGPDASEDLGPQDLGPRMDGGQHQPLRLLASGGGGCVCNVGVGGSGSGGAGGLAALGFLLAALFSRRRHAATRESKQAVAQ